MKTVVGIIVALLVALGSAGIGYWFSTRQAEDAETKRATGATRVLAENLRLAEERLYSSLIDCRYRLYDFEVGLPIDDLILVAWRLDSGQWDKVGRAIDQYNLQLRRSKEATGFASWDLKQAKVAIKYIDDARHALQEESGQQPSSSETLRTELAEECP